MKIRHLAAILILINLSVLAKPIVSEKGVISIKPGESFYIQFDKTGNLLTNPTVVTEMKEKKPCVFIQCASSFPDLMVVPKNPNSLLTFMIKEQPNMTILLIQKNVKEVVQYKCRVLPKGKSKFESRRNLPLEMGFPMLENYPEKLDVIQLSNFQLSSSDTK